MFKISFFCFEKEVKVAVKKLLNLNVGCDWKNNWMDVKTNWTNVTSLWTDANLFWTDMQMVWMVCQMLWTDFFEAFKRITNRYRWFTHSNRETLVSILPFTVTYAWGTCTVEQKVSQTLMLAMGFHPTSRFAHSVYIMSYTAQQKGIFGTFHKMLWNKRLLSANKRKDRREPEVKKLKVSFSFSLAFVTYFPSAFPDEFWISLNLCSLMLPMTLLHPVIYEQPVTLDPLLVTCFLWTITGDLLPIAPYLVLVFWPIIVTRYPRSTTCYLLCISHYKWPITHDPLLVSYCLWPIFNDLLLITLFSLPVIYEPFLVTFCPWSTSCSLFSIAHN